MGAGVSLRDGLTAQVELVTVDALASEVASVA